MNQARKVCCAALVSGVVAICALPVFAAKRDPKIEATIAKALEFLAREQKKPGYWEANGGAYRAAMTALAGTAFLAEGSTTTRGKYSGNIVRAVDFLLDAS